MKSFSLTCVALSVLSASNFAAAFSVENNNSVNSRRAFITKQGGAALVGIASSLILGGDNKANAADVISAGGSIKFGEDKELMSPKAHGTSEYPVQSDLLYGVSNKLADKICNYNRHFAEMGGYFESTSFEQIVRSQNGPLTFYDR